MRKNFATRVPRPPPSDDIGAGQRPGGVEISDWTTADQGVGALLDLREPGSRHTGPVDNAAPGHPRARTWTLLGLAVAALVTLVAWVVLVRAAIGFGRDARAGESYGWAFLAVAALGAVACLAMALVLAFRMLAVLRGSPPARPKGGEHRAAR